MPWAPPSEERQKRGWSPGQRIKVVVGGWAAAFVLGTTQTANLEGTKPASTGSHADQRPWTQTRRLTNNASDHASTSLPTSGGLS